MFQRPYPQPQLHVGLVIADLFDLFGHFMWSIACQQVGTQSLETVKLRIFVSLWG